MSKHLKRSLADRLFSSVMVFPYVILFALTTGPLLYSLVSSLYHRILYDPSNVKFIGLGNYISMLRSENFWNAMRNTGYQVGVTVTLQFVIGLVCALLLSRDDIFMSKIARTLFLLPMMTTPVVVGLAWRMLYNPDMGMINFVLGLLGFGGPNWLGSADWAMPAMILTDLWLSTPFMTVILFAGIQSLPREPYEAALVDGANKAQSFFKITLPLLKPIILVGLMFRLMDAFRRFETIFTMTGGGPGRATETLNLYIYFEGFDYLNIGYASALSAILMLMMFVISTFLIRIIKQNEGE